MFKAWQLQGPQPAQSVPPWEVLSIPEPSHQGAAAPPSPAARKGPSPEEQREEARGPPSSPLCPFSGGLSIAPTSAVALGVWELGSRTGRAVRGGQRGEGVSSKCRVHGKRSGKAWGQGLVPDALTRARLWVLPGSHLRMRPEVQTLTLDVGQAEWPGLLSWAPPPALFSTSFHRGLPLPFYSPVWLSRGRVLAVWR